MTPLAVLAPEHVPGFATAVLPLLIKQRDSDLRRGQIAAASAVTRQIELYEAARWMRAERKA